MFSTRPFIPRPFLRAVLQCLHVFQGFDSLRACKRMPTLARKPADRPKPTADSREFQTLGIDRTNQDRRHPVCRRHLPLQTNQQARLLAGRLLSHIVADRGNRGCNQVLRRKAERFVPGASLFRQEWLIASHYVPIRREQFGNHPNG